MTSNLKKKLVYAVISSQSSNYPKGREISLIFGTLFFGSPEIQIHQESVLDDVNWDYPDEIFSHIIGT